MSFPYTLTKNITFSKSDYWIEDLPQNFSQLFIEALKHKGYLFQDEYFISRHSLFSIPFKFEINTELSKGDLRVVYHLHLQNLVNGIIVILLLSAFFSRFSFGTFLWSSFLISVLFYQLSILIINTGIKKQIYQILSAYKKVKQESDIEYWIKENDRNCPACGAKLDNHSLFCEECGLKIRQNAYSKPLNLDGANTSGAEEKPQENKKEENMNSPQVNYQYKKKQNS